MSGLLLRRPVVCLRCGHAGEVRFRGPAMLIRVDRIRVFDAGLVRRENAIRVFQLTPGASLFACGCRRLGRGILFHVYSASGNARWLWIRSIAGGGRGFLVLVRKLPGLPGRSRRLGGPDPFCELWSRSWPPFRRLLMSTEGRRL